MAAGLRAALARPLRAIKPEHLARGAVAVEVLLRVHGDPVGGRRPEGRPPLLHRAGHASPATSRRAALALRRQRGERRLPDRAEAQHVPAQAVATAMAAAMIDPPGPGRSPPPLIHVGWRRNASSTAVTPPSLMPMPPAPGYVDSPSMSSSVSPASATAARHTSTARDSGSTMRRRPSAERPTPESTARCSNARRRSAAAGRGRAGPALGRRVVVPVPRRAAATRPRTARSAPSLPGRWRRRTGAADDVRREMDAGVFGERDVRDHVRRLEGRVPLVRVRRCSRRWCPDPRPRRASTTGSGTTGRSASAGGRAVRSPRSPGPGARRRRPTSRTTPWRASAQGAVAMCS